MLIAMKLYKEKGEGISKTETSECSIEGGIGGEGEKPKRKERGNLRRDGESLEAEF